MDVYNFVQHADVPTHVGGNTLDLVISKSDLNVHAITTDHSVNSDHYAVLFSVSTKSPGVPKQTIVYRKWKSININNLSKDLESSLSNVVCDNVETAVKNYNSITSSVIDKHAPEKTCIVTVRPEARWRKKTEETM